MPRSKQKPVEPSPELMKAFETLLPEKTAPVGHTPGPWRADAERYPHVPDGNVWWRIYAGTEDESDLVAHMDRTTRTPQRLVIDVGRTAEPTPSIVERDAANARLIAAAPRMLDELRKVEWGAYDVGGSTGIKWATCPSCGGINPDDRFLVWGMAASAAPRGHRDNCTLANALAAAEGRAS